MSCSYTSASRVTAKLLSYCLVYILMLPYITTEIPRQFVVNYSALICVDTQIQSAAYVKHPTHLNRLMMALMFWDLRLEH